MAKDHALLPHDSTRRNFLNWFLGTTAGAFAISVLAILINTPAGELKAFSATCTHLGCIVQYRSDLSQIWCACHNGHFDLNGKNVEGPPPRPLEEYVVNVRGDQIIVSKRS